MDYMVYVDNSNDRFSLLDMIEKDCEALDSDEKRRISLSSEVIHSEKNKLFANELRQPVQAVAAQLGDGNWLDSASLKVVSANMSDAAVGMNKDPHLLVNPRTVAPLLDNDAVKEETVGAMSVSENAEVTDVAFCEVEPSAKLIKIDASECELLPSQAQIVSLSNADQNYSTGTTLLTPASVNVTNPVGTMQVFLQVASTVGNLMQTGGSVCFVVEPQTLCTTAVAQNSETDSVSTATLQQTDTDVSIKEEPGSTEAYEKPVFSYSCLIAMALKNSDTGSLPVNEIYAYILEKFPYFRSAPDGWKNSIRHNLSLNKCFEKIENPTVNGGSRKGCLWGLNPAKADKMDEEIAKWIKRASKSNGTVNGVSCGNLVDCSAVGSLQNAMTTLVSDISDDAVSGSLQNKAGNVVICPDIQPPSTSCPTSGSTETEYFTMLEDSFSSDPMLAGLAVQNGLWDDLTETDELMSSAMSFSGTQLSARGGKKTAETPQSAAGSNNILTASTTCRSFHSKGVTIASGRAVDTSDVIVISQPAIG